MSRSAIMLLAAMGIIGGMPHTYQPPRKREPHEIPTPEWNVLTVPQGCTKETITVTYERNGYEYTVQGDICYKGLKTRSQRKIKLEQQIRNWICQCPDYYLAQHPRVTVKTIEGYERPKTALDSL